MTGESRWILIKHHKKHGDWQGIRRKRGGWRWYSTLSPHHAGDRVAFFFLGCTLCLTCTGACLHSQVECVCADGKRCEWMKCACLYEYRLDERWWAMVEGWPMGQRGCEWWYSMARLHPAILSPPMRDLFSLCFFTIYLPSERTYYTHRQILPVYSHSLLPTPLSLPSHDATQFLVCLAL